MARPLPNKANHARIARRRVRRARRVDASYSSRAVKYCSYVIDTVERGAVFRYVMILLCSDSAV